MNILYFDCGMGVAGDMLTSALLDITDNKEAFIKEFNMVGIPGVKMEMTQSQKCGINGLSVRVTVNGKEEQVEEHVHGRSHEHEHAHHPRSSMLGIEHIINDLNVSDKVKTDATAVYNLIADAESHVHNVPVSDIHFHEVGTMDAVADIVAVCMLMELISPDKIIASPVNMGSGHVRCAHGFLPVPAPATAYLLKGIPIYAGDVTGELCTPTGAALLKYFADDFSNMPTMKPGKIGYGMGKKNFEYANCVRVFFCRTDDSISFVYELKCNLDDMTAENLSFAMDRLFDAGALDVYTESVGMKKSRQGTLLTVLYEESEREKILHTVFKYTSTIGVREQCIRRYVLDRESVTAETPFGSVSKKISRGFGVQREKYEYEDLAQIAEENNMSIEELRRLLP